MVGFISDLAVSVMVFVVVFYWVMALGYGWIHKA